ncbi:MAG: HsmA family protein [Bacteroidetes bacterium]|nr:HsmA family protein [Bacteroidota bacterium]
MLLVAVHFITLACVLYTIGVWAERIRRKLKWWHTIFFWAGFISDTTGTTAMGIMAGSFFRSTFHGITGLSAILLMLFHAIWATIVLVRKDEKMILNFHRFSIIVWIIWLIPMVSGIILGAKF